MIETLLLNFLFLLFPVLIFLIFFENRLHYYILLFLSSISMVLCMVYPLKLEGGYIFDLRYIPFLIVALFGGYKYTFPMYILLNVYRYLIGGPGIGHSFIFSTIIFVSVPLLHKKFIKQSPRNRIIGAVIVSFLSMVIYITWFGIALPRLNKEFWLLTFYALTTGIVVMAIIMILIEKIMVNIKTRESFLHSERLSVLSDLSASVSHEIRNPLTVTKGFLQLLNTSQAILGEEKKYIEYSLLELKRAEKIVSDFLAFAKPQSENMIYSNLKNEIEYVKNVMTPYANMYLVEIEFYFNNLSNIQYDKNQILQSLINLFKNAIEAMREKGGTLYIDVTNEKKDIMIKIRDTGVGMTREEVLLLGRPYYSSKKEGTGLGMLMVYSTIDKLKGKIEVESEKGKGTTFYISIPV
ncbi:MAG: HAMP domain-containing sensor histidine kinase [Bacillota bacterium]|nr:HAMP domain-containing sensor histidine kinase [Bacillota bacterium]